MLQQKIQEENLKKREQVCTNVADCRLFNDLILECYCVQNAMLGAGRKRDRSFGKRAQHDDDTAAKGRCGRCSDTEEAKGQV